MSKEINNNIYIELDSIVDSRLGVLYTYDKDLASTILKDDKYHKRYLDEFGYISNKSFEKMYNTRDRSILDNVTPTGIVNLLKEYKLGATEVNTEYGKEEKTKVYLNVYPYKLFDTELQNLKIALNVIFKDDFIVEVVYMDKEELSPSWIDDHVGILVKYDGMKWLERELSVGRLKDNPLPDIGLIIPAMVTGNLIIKPDNINGFFEDTVKAFSPFINIHFLPSDSFSIIIKPKKDI